MDTIQDRNPSSHISSASDDSRLVINLSGKFGLMNLSDFSTEIKNLLQAEAATGRVDVDFSGVSYIDSAAALAMFSLRQECAARNIDCRLVNFPENTRRIFDIIDADERKLNHCRRNIGVRATARQ